VFDPGLYASTGQIRITNFFGFFILGAQAPPNFSLQGVLVTQPGLFVGTGGTVNTNAAFVKVIQLIR
jgi:hypothetical protein